MKLKNLSIGTKFNILSIMLILLASLGIASYLTYNAISQRHNELIHHGSPLHN